MSDSFSDNRSSSEILINNPNTEETVPLWDVKDVARYLKYDPSTVRAMARRGDIPSFKVGREWRFEPKDVKAFLNTLKG